MNHSSVSSEFSRSESTRGYKKRLGVCKTVKYALTSYFLKGLSCIYCLEKSSKPCAYEVPKLSCHIPSSSARCELTDAYFQFIHQFMLILWICPCKEKYLLQYPSHRAAIKESQLATWVLFS